MRLRRQVCISLLVQAAGAASVLLATLLLGTCLGPEQQGRFSRTKAEIEFVAAMAMFGLPQALFYYVKSGQMSSQTALRWAGWSVLAAGPIGMAYGFVQHGGNSNAYFSELAVAIALCVAHGQLRALVLVADSTEWFNGITALPQLLVLGGVAVVLWVLASGNFAWQILFAVAYGTAAALALGRVKIMRTVAVVAAIRWPGLSRYGMAAWLQATLSTSAILLVQYWVERSQGAEALGQFTMAMTLTQVPLTPVSYAAPLLFRFWMERPGGRASQRWSAALFTALLCVAGLIWVAAPVWPQLGLGRGYAGVTQALAVLLVGGAAEAASRVLIVNANAIGKPWVGVKAEAARWAVFGGAWAVFWPQGLLSVCAIWATGAWAAAAVFATHSRSVKASAVHQV